MYAALREWVARFGSAFLDTMQTRIPFEAVRAVHIDIDRTFLAWSNTPFRLDPMLLQAAGPGSHFWHRHVSTLDSLMQTHLRPPAWDVHCRTMGYPDASSPIVIRVAFREAGVLRAAAELPLAFREYPILYESRPECRALGNAVPVGAAVSGPPPTRAGTAGGFLRDTQSDKKYVVSCAHVLGEEGEQIYQHRQGLSANPVPIGVVRLSIVAPPKALNLACNRHTHANPDALDLAVAALEDRLKVSPTRARSTWPQFVTPISRMSTGDPVTITAHNGRLVQGELGSLALYHEISVEGQNRCFGDIFALSHRRPWYLNTKLVKPGDSGSWVTRDAGDVTGWDGMIFAGDGAYAYACFAETITDHCHLKMAGSLVLCSQP